MPVESLQQVFEARRQVIARQVQESSDLDTSFHELVALRETVEKALRNYQEKAVSLQKSVRRSPSEDSGRYNTYLATQLRMAGAIVQALKRASAMDRVLDAVKQEQHERLQREQAERQRLAVQHATQETRALILPPSDEDDFEFLYGSEELNDAE